MITDQQYRRLMKLMNTEETQAIAASKAGMDIKTARKYNRAGKQPSEMKKPHNWATRANPFSDVWPDIEKELKAEPEYEAKTLFEALQEKYPEQFTDGQLRTFQRKVKRWRATKGPSKEVFFPQNYRAGENAQSDFTNMNSLGISIQGQPFTHKVFHLVLPYSSWEHASICLSESFESLQEGLQNALFTLGAVPKFHQSDSLSAAVKNSTNPKTFTDNYSALLRHFGLLGKKTNGNSPHENGAIEQ
jgi:hypothetical protein